MFIQRGDDLDVDHCFGMKYKKLILLFYLYDKHGKHALNVVVACKIYLNLI